MYFWNSVLILRSWGSWGSSGFSLEHMCEPLKVSSLSLVEVVPMDYCSVHIGMWVRQQRHQISFLLTRLTDYDDVSSDQLCISCHCCLPGNFNDTIRVPIRKCIWLCFGYVIEFLMLIREMAFIFHKSKAKLNIKIPVTLLNDILIFKSCWMCKFYSKGSFASTNLGE